MATQNMLKCNTITALELDILKNDFEKASNNISHFHEILNLCDGIITKMDHNSDLCRTTQTCRKNVANIAMVLNSIHNLSEIVKHFNNKFEMAENDLYIQRMEPVNKVECQGSLIDTSLEYLNRNTVGYTSYCFLISVIDYNQQLCRIYDLQHKNVKKMHAILSTISLEKLIAPPQYGDYVALELEGNFYRGIVLTKETATKFFIYFNDILEIRCVDITMDGKIFALPSSLYNSAASQVTCKLHINNIQRLEKNSKHQIYPFRVVRVASESECIEIELLSVTNPFEQAFLDELQLSPLHKLAELPDQPQPLCRDNCLYPSKIEAGNNGSNECLKIHEANKVANDWPLEKRKPVELFANALTSRTSNENAITEQMPLINSTSHSVGRASLHTILCGLAKTPMVNKNLHSASLHQPANECILKFSSKLLAKVLDVHGLLMPLPNEGTVTIMPTHIFGATEFFAQLGEKQHIFERFTSNLAFLYGEYKLEPYTKAPAPTHYVIVALNEMETFARGYIIQNISNERSELFLLDYGRIEYASYRDMFHWHTNCTAIPFQIVHCVLYNAKPKNDIAIELKGCAHLRERILLKYFEADIIESSENRLIVRLVDSDMYDIGEELCALEVADCR